jgi:hypothetical protein
MRQQTVPQRLPRLHRRPVIVVSRMEILLGTVMDITRAITSDPALVSFLAWVGGIVGVHLI